MRPGWPGFYLSVTNDTRIVRYGRNPGVMIMLH